MILFSPNTSKESITTCTIRPFTKPNVCSLNIYHSTQFVKSPSSKTVKPIVNLIAQRYQGGDDILPSNQVEVTVEKSFKIHVCVVKNLLIPE